MKVKRTQEFTAGYRFHKDGMRTAVLDRDGRFAAFDDGDNMTAYPSWKDFLKGHNIPITGLDTEEDIVTMLEMQGLGVSEVIQSTIETPVETKAVTVAPAKKAAKQTKAEEATQGEDNTMATKTPAKKTAAKTAKPVTKKAAKPATKKTAAAPKEQSPCKCGCGTMVNKNFAQGHDAKVHGWGRKVSDGRMKFSEINALTKDGNIPIKFLKDHGITQGVAAK